MTYEHCFVHCLTAEF